MPDQFAYDRQTLISPPENGFTVTPNDGADLPFVTRQLYVGGAGTVAGILNGGYAFTFTAVAGQFVDLRFKKIMATGTTATGLVGLY